MGDFTRRKFIVVTTLAAGFALAVHPISAQVINTDTKDLVAGVVKIPVMAKFPHIGRCLLLAGIFRWCW